jgi:hypothetical protein
MDRLFTVEIRWFFKGLIPAEVETWFARQLPGNNLLHETPRTDIYFIVQERDDLGLKLSRGSLELKWRQDSQPFSLDAPVLAGVKETWIKEKWKYAKKHGDKIASGFNRPRLKGWRVEIQKQRTVREYRADSSEKITALTQFLNFDALTGENYPPVVKIELTTLSKLGKPWWTLGLEAAGEPQTLQQVFEQAVHDLLKDYPQTDLQSSNSYGYPWWVAQVED